MTNKNLEKMKKEDLKIVFFGTPEFAVASLERLVTKGYNVAAVVTMTNGGSVNAREQNRMNISREEKDGTNHKVSKSNRKQYVSRRLKVPPEFLYNLNSAYSPGLDVRPVENASEPSIKSTAILFI